MSQRPGQAASSEVLLAPAIGLMWSGRLGEASKIMEELLQDHPGHPGVLLAACDLRLLQDDAESALALIEQAVSLVPGSLRLLSRQASVLMASMRRGDAKQVAEQMAAMAPRDADVAWEAGRIFARCDHPEGAQRHLSQAVALGGKARALLYDLASAQFFLGMTDAAEVTLDSMLAEPGVSSSGSALYLRSTVRTQSCERNHVQDLERRLENGLRDPGDASGCFYAMAKELEDLGQWSRSFVALREGARLKRSTLSYDAASERATIARIGQVYTQKAMEAVAPAHEASGMVFIVGLPRTGTTLVERILARHPGAASLGELPYFSGGLATAVGRLQRTGHAPRDPVAASLQIDFSALGRVYMGGARQAADRHAQVLVDKMPANFMYCGLIRKALPAARIIHLVREPMDACYAIYKTLFQQAYHYSYDLDELADYYATYHRLMRHWHEVMPGEILDVKYEDLVAEPEAQADRILQWCGLPWDAAVLDITAQARPASTASSRQVREPVHVRSVGKWRRYEAELAGLRARLLEQGVPLDGATPG